MIRFIPTLLILCAGLASAQDPHQHGAGVELGEITLLGIGIDVEAEGPFKPGSEIHLDLSLEPATAAFKAIRAWVGPEKGRVTKSSITGSNGKLHGHLDVPSPIPAESQLWIELEPVTGTATRAAVALPAAK